MQNLPWLDRVRKRLAEHGLPPTYIQRCVTELTDHLDDLKDETTGTEADVCSRLGEPEQVAGAAIVAYRRRHFLGRHPVAAFLVFAISPVIAWWVFLVLLLGLARCGVQGTYNWDEHPWLNSLTIVGCSTFVGVLYSELAVWCGLGKRWTLVSCVELGAIAMFFGLAFGFNTVRLLVLFAAVLAVGWWIIKRNRNHSYPATKLTVFAVSPIASYTLLFTLVPLIIFAVPSLVGTYFGAACMYGSMLLIPTVLTGLVLFRFAKKFRSGRKRIKWILFPCIALVTFPAVLLASTLLLPWVPTVVASLLYCKLAKWAGVGRKWVLVSCMVLAVYTAQLPSDGFSTTCLKLTQILLPFVVACWFIRRQHDQGQLQLAS